MHDMDKCAGDKSFGANDRYHLCSPPKSGNYGSVYRAWDNHEKMYVALKLIREPGPAFTFEEAQRLVELDGDRVVKVFNADIHNDVPYVAMSFAPLGDLEHRVGPNGVATSVAVRWSQSILSGVEACHRRRLVHRDIKLSNVLVFDLNDDIKLGDFGIVAAVDPAGFVPVHGDSRIVAPEGISTGRLTFQSDVYSTAIAAYYLLAGHWPTRQPDGRLVDNLADECPQIPMRLLAIVRKAWAHNPAERYGSATEFREALANMKSPDYDWRRVDTADPKLVRWEGTHAQRETVAVTAQLGSAVSIVARHAESGRRIRGTERTASRAAAPTELRKVFKHLDSDRPLFAAAG